ncbi:Serine-threonine kinase receptor-associated protein [Geodia barretti]|uniref:Serine-threonine kinase receptor-associated protein n=1 Tax=Geodia barretti TaxID=519541 RepID=A0AA35T596_GEOBA|nr:Serine-threonine kinase receptor-associated protein [Geodia barretti]
MRAMHLAHIRKPTDLLWRVCEIFSDSIFSALSKSFEKVKTVSVPLCYSATLHPSGKWLVTGGDDFKLYKFDYEEEKEVESYKGHFGPVHCVRYSPDGEVYCSGSEDGTIRLWQHSVGKSYGLWRSADEVVASRNNHSNNSSNNRHPCCFLGNSTVYYTQRHHHSQFCTYIRYFKCNQSINQFS